MLFTSPRLVVINFLLMLSISNVAFSIEYRPHVHGHATLTIAIEKNNLELSLMAPTESLLGFEHKAKSQDEISQAIEMKKHLSRYSNVIQFIDGECQIKNTKIDMGDILGSYDHSHLESSHQHTHHEIAVNYQLNCQNADSISDADVLLFNQYKALNKVTVMLVTSSRQSAMELDASNTRITLN